METSRTHNPWTKQKAGQARRRRGTVLVLVMALLGILFVMGVTFITSMNSAEKVGALEEHRMQAEAAGATMMSEAGIIVRDAIIAKAGVPFGSEPTGASSVAWAEALDIHNTFSPAVPVWYPSFADPNRRLVFRSYTDLAAIRAGVFDGSSQRALRGGTVAEGVCDEGTVLNWRPFVGLDTTWTPGQPVCFNPGGGQPVFELIPLDADGDGIVDSIASPGAAIGLSEVQRSELSALVNPDGMVNPEVYMGLRIVSHGAMVDLNEAHPKLIENILAGREGVTVFHRPSRPMDDGQRFYSPTVNEYLLRRRGGIPPRVLPPSKLLGNSSPLVNRQQFPYGEGDLAEALFGPSGGGPLDFQTPFTGGHQYWPFDPTEVHPWSNQDPDRTPVSVWGMRRDADAARAYDASGSGFEFDRIPLVTTTSTGDNLARAVAVPPRSIGAPGTPQAGTPIGTAENLLLLMRDANAWAWHPESCEPPFEYANYPHDLPNEGDCACSTDPTCVFNPRKGRMKLSIPWLQNALDNPPYSFDAAKGQRLVHDVFIMMLLNARDLSNNWATYVDTGLPAGVDPYWRPDYDEISRTAASLTANFFDFADTDDTPTRVALRQVNFGDFSEDYLRAVGRETEPAAPKYVYGIERQPFISEAAIALTPYSAGQTEDPTGLEDLKTAWAVELFNPYDVDIEANDTGGQVNYLLVSYDPSANPGQATHIDNAPRMPISMRIPAGGFAVITAGDSNELQVPAGVPMVELPESFLEYVVPGSRLALVRSVQYPGETNRTEIVVDQFGVSISLIDELPPDLPMGDVVFSVERVAAANNRWRVTVPLTESQDFTHTIGLNNSYADLEIRPVEIQFASTGNLVTAYPTTGSMLLLMRHANRAITKPTTQNPTQVTSDVGRLAFTSRLAGPDSSPQMVDGAPATVTTEISTQIDNGRMPVFDLGRLHHVDPSFVAPGTPGDVETLPWGQLVFDYFTAVPLSNPGPYRAGEADLLNPEWLPGNDPAAKPRVDMDGLRVHGQINLNVAPWRVIQGLPLVPMEKIPAAFRAKIRNAIGLVSPTAADPLDPAPGDLNALDNEAATLGEEMARAIVAYRDQNQQLDVNDLATWTPVGATGNYGSGDPANPGLDPAVGSRRWDAVDAEYRRGSGFLTIGELANLRHRDAKVDPDFQPIRGFTGYSSYRVDGGLTTATNAAQQDYVSAVALLVSLNDWVSVRSQVFTVYGTIRGKLDTTNPDFTALPDDVRGRAILEDADSRAIRFQETIDRLPTWLGEPLPRRIGERVLVRYTDTYDD
jgi:hypothetical protein